MLKCYCCNLLGTRQQSGVTKLLVVQILDFYFAVFSVTVFTMGHLFAVPQSATFKCMVDQHFLVYEKRPSKMALSQQQASDIVAVMCRSSCRIYIRITLETCLFWQLQEPFLTAQHPSMYMAHQAKLRKRAQPAPLMALTG